MRRWFVAFCLLGFATQAVAGDFDVPTLRGSSPFIPASPKYFRWSGIYAGGQVGTTAASIDFGDAAQGLIGNILRETRLESEFRVSEWSRLPSDSDRSVAKGGFIGYNTQWEDAVVGIDASYTRLAVSGSASDAISRIVTMSDFAYTVTVTSSASYQLTDLGTLRLRGGWALGNFLPYATLGVAAGYGSYSRSASVGYPTPVYALPPPTPPDQPPPTPPSFGPVSESQSRINKVIWGWALGGGLDFAVMPNVFLRAEYEFVALPIAGMQMNLQNFRVGGAVKY